MEKKLTAEDIENARAILARVDQEQAEAEKKALEEAMAPKKFKAGRWICVEDCFHNGKLYKDGDAVEWKKASEAPVVDGFVRHFQPEA